jgi:molybdopterin-guanine dinucleotide biosynthesis protein A
VLVEGTRIIDRVADALRPAVDELLIVANHAGAPTWLPGVQVVEDRYPFRASLVGIHAALSAAGRTTVVAGWDMPFVPPGLARHLVALATPEWDAVIPIGPSGPEACFAVYGPALLPVIERALTEKRLSLRGFAREIPRVCWVPVDDVARFGDPTRIFTNVNSAADLP